MITLEGHFFDGLRPICAPAKMEFSDREATLTAGPVCEHYAISRLSVSPRIGSTDRFISLPDGGQFACADIAFLDSLPQESRSESPVAWLEERWGVAVAGVAIIFCILIAGYFLGLPFAAERVVARIPVQAEQPLGRQTLNWLDTKEWLKPTTLNSDARKRITDAFGGLCSDLPSKDIYRLEFRSGNIFGPNAFALPGGIIVISDDMVRAAADMEEIMAVLAHEIGHVELRHTLRSVLQKSVVGAAAALLTSDGASLSVAVSGLPVLVAQTKYSREFEAAADEYAFRLLQQKGFSPAAFASLMERLEKNVKQPGVFAYISSHPMTADRIRRARAAAMPQAVAPHSGIVDEGRSPLNLSEEEIRSQLIGTWFGDEPAKKGGRHMWIVQRKGDGTYETNSRQIDASGNKKDTIAVGDWGIEGDNFFSLRTGVFKNDKVDPADPANPYKRHNFRILNLTGEHLEYQSGDSSNKTTVRRVPAGFDFSAGGEYCVSREGFVKEYNYTLNRRNEKREMELESIVGPKTNLNGIEVSTTITTIRKPGAGPLSNKFFSVENDEGIRSIASLNPFDKSLRYYNQDAWELKYPLIVGKNWTTTDEINRLKEKFTVPVTCVIEAMDAVISVPAGTYKNCVRIKKSFNGKVNFSSHGGEAEVAVERYSWYAPGLGYIKGLDNIKCSNPELGGEESHLEMTSYKN